MVHKGLRWSKLESSFNDTLSLLIIWVRYYLFFKFLTTSSVSTIHGFQSERSDETRSS